MARRSRTKVRVLRRRRPQAHIPGDDRISALSDYFLLLVLRRLDTRTALGAGLLSRRWARPPPRAPPSQSQGRRHTPPALPPIGPLRNISSNGAYVQYRVGAKNEKLLPDIRRYERRAMRGLISSVKGLLDADDGGVRARRRVSRLRLEFFATHNAGCINGLISRAIDAWGVDDLEAVAKPMCRQQTVHTFRSHGLCQDPRASRLRSLKLGGCVLPPLHEYSTLTMLVLQGVPDSPAAPYEGVFTTCQLLEVLHLKSCRCEAGDMVVVVDAPMSEIRELVVDHCHFLWMRLRALPSLEQLASLDTKVFFECTSFPCLRQLNLTCDLGIRLKQLRQYFRQHLEVDLFLRCTPDITDLIIRFTGPDRWIVPSSSPSSLLPNLRWLLVADVPSSWDVTWPRLLFEMAPSLESFHIHIAPCMEGTADEISWSPTKLRQHHLKEFVMAGFEGTERQVYLVRFVMGVCTALRHVAMFKNGHAQNKGHWDWEMVTQQHSWTDEEKDTTLKHIMGRVSSSTTPVQLVLG